MKNNSDGVPQLADDFGFIFWFWFSSYFDFGFIFWLGFIFWFWFSFRGRVRDANTYHCACVIIIERNSFTHFSAIHRQQHRTIFCTPPKTSKNWKIEKYQKLEKREMTQPNHFWTKFDIGFIFKYIFLKFSYGLYSNIQIHQKTYFFQIYFQ